MALSDTGGVGSLECCLLERAMGIPFQIGDVGFGGEAPKGPGGVQTVCSPGAEEELQQAFAPHSESWRVRERVAPGERRFAGRK